MRGKASSGKSNYNKNFYLDFSEFLWYTLRQLRSRGALHEAILGWRARPWRLRMRLATVPGRSARPAPPGNDDPCGERRTIPEGLPRLPREALNEVSDGRFESSEAFGEGGPTTASTGPGQKSHVERRKGERFHRRKRRTPHRKSSFAVRSAQIDRGHGGPVVRNVRKAGSFARACRSMRRLHAGHGVPIWVRRRHPGATGAPHAPREGAAKCEEEANSEWRVANREKEDGRNVESRERRE